MEKMNKRYEGIDILRFLGAFFIICIHSKIPGEIGGYITCIAQFAVPSFLIITGFFYHNLTQQKRVRIHIFKILYLFLCINLLYFFYHVVVQIYRGNLWPYLQDRFSIETIFKFVFLNESPFAPHGWYLGAVLYTMLITEIIRKITPNWKRVLYFVCFPLLIIGLLLGNYSFLFFKSFTLPVIFVRNFLFTGIPYFAIGLFIYEKKDFFLCYEKVIAPLLWVVFFVFVTIIERFILRCFNVDLWYDQYISTMFFSVSVFCLFSNNAWNDHRFLTIKAIGRKHSMMIYIIHFIPVGILTEIILKLFSYDFLYYTLPVVIFAISLLFSIIYYQLKQWIKNLWRRKRGYQ